MVDNQLIIFRVRGHLSPQLWLHRTTATLSLMYCQCLRDKKQGCKCRCSAMLHHML